MSSNREAKKSKDLAGFLWFFFVGLSSPLLPYNSLFGSIFLRPTAPRAFFGDYLLIAGGECEECTGGGTARLDVAVASVSSY